VSTTEELLDKKSSGSCLENREYGRKDPSRWPRGTLYPQKLATILPRSGGRSVDIVRSRTQTVEFNISTLCVWEFRACPRSWMYVHHRGSISVSRRVSAGKNETGLWQPPPPPTIYCFLWVAFVLAIRNKIASNDVTAFLPRADEDVAFLMHCLPSSLHEILFIVFALHETSHPISRDIWNRLSIKQLHWAEPVMKMLYIVALIITIVKSQDSLLR
jgi:hypothetical protein